MMRSGFLVLVIAAVTLAGCGWLGIRDRSGDYRLAEEIPMVKVPDGLDDTALSQLYPIPEIPETSLLDEDTETPRPQPLSSSLLEEEVKIQVLGQKRWIWINRAPGEIWPRVRNILNTNGVPTAQVDAAAGAIETVWLEFDDDLVNVHRYRFGVEQGVQLNSTELFILHSSMPVDGEIPPWPFRSVSDEREKTMAEFVASSLAGDLSEGSVSLLGQSIGGGAKVKIVAPKDETPSRLVKLGFERAWASVAYSVSRDEFTIVDQNQSGGVFYINDGDSEEDDEPGFFGKLFSFGDDDADKDGPVESQYQVLLKETGEGVEVSIIAPGETLERSDILRLLKRIRTNLA